MEKFIFESERCFIIHDVFVSHGQLLIRSQKNENFLTNIDIIFFDTTYIQLYTMLHGISIKALCKNEIIEYRTVHKYLSYKNNHLFEMESDGEKYYIAASYFKVYENDLGFNESSLGVLQYQGRDNEIVNSF